MSTTETERRADAGDDQALDALHLAGQADPGPVPGDPAPRVPLVGSLPWDHEVRTYADLALFCGGSDDSFTGDLLRLIAHADPTNRVRLARIFPKEVLATSIWSELLAPTTAAGLLGLMALTAAGGAVPGDPVGTVAAAEWAQHFPGIVVR